jgi:hypothetical protein
VKITYLYIIVDEMRRKVSSLSPGIGIKSRQLFKLDITEPSLLPPNNNYIF